VLKSVRLILPQDDASKHLHGPLSVQYCRLGLSHGVLYCTVHYRTAQYTTWCTVL